MRRVFFGPQGDTTWNRERLILSQQHFHHHELDVRRNLAVDHVVIDKDRLNVELVAKEIRFKEAVIDDDIAADFFNPSGGDLTGDLGISGQWIRFG